MYAWEEELFDKYNGEWESRWWEPGCEDSNNEENIDFDNLWMADEELPFL